jgi:aminobenzoyl-glutamate utilization protein B
MKRVFLSAILFCTVALLSVNVVAQKPADVVKKITEKEAYYASLSQQIWGFAEVGYQEYKSSKLLQETLEKEGFKIETGVAEIPTAFTATFGSGKPVIGILGEFDALPGLSQDAVPEKKSLGGKAGHACGHHLFGVGSAAAAIAVKDWMKQTGQKGTIRFYGTPAEEGGSGKVYMVRAGLFNDADVVLHWHPGASNSANASSSLANISAKFRFSGVSAHAAGAPDKGRSALDGVEALNYMVNMMREHVPSDTRIHYVITDGGKAPNVVPDFAEVYYYTRSPRRTDLVDIWDRIKKASEGAAMGTGTTVTHEIIGGVYEILPNETLARMMHANLEKVGGVTYNAEEKAFADKISATLTTNPYDNIDPNAIEPFEVKMRGGGGSTDVADISWVVPTVGLRTATWVPFTPAHSWQAVAAGGTSIGKKGMMVAAKTMALTAIELFQQPAVIEKAKTEFIQKRGGEAFEYKALIGDRKPALDYRN